MKKFLFVKGENTHVVDLIRFIKLYSKESVECHVLMVSYIGGLILKSKYIDKIHLLKGKNLASKLKELDGNFHYDRIIPIGYPEVEIVSRIKNDFLNINSSEYDILSLALSKTETLLLARELQIPTPRSILLNTIEDIKKYKWEFPVFVKGDKEGSNRGKAESVNKLSELSSIIINEGRKPLIQELIPANETYGVGFFSINGIIKEYSIHKELLSIPPSGGSGVILSAIQNDKLLYYSSKLIKRLNYSGIGLVEFKYDPRRNDYFLMEINPKIWASIAFALQCNPALIEAFLEIEIEKINIQNPNALYVYPDRLLRLGFYDVRKLKFGIKIIVENRENISSNFDTRDLINIFSNCSIAIASGLLSKERNLWRIE